MQKIVVSMQGRMNAGQVYVALSRATSLSGLFLLDVNSKKMKASEKVKKEYARLREEMALTTYHSHVVDDINHNPPSQLLAVHNIRSLRAHHADLCKLPLLEHCDVMCLTETWLQRNQVSIISIAKSQSFNQSSSNSFVSG